MTAAITLWLAFVLAVGAVTWFGTRRQAIAFVLIAILTAPAVPITLGHAAPWTPAPGHYTVLGAKIEMDVAIWVLLDTPDGPRFYKLPYTPQTANGLQKAMDMAEGNGGTVGLEQGEEGSPGFAEEGGTSGEPAKVPEQQMIGGVE